MSMSRNKVRRTPLNRLWIFALSLKRSTKLQTLKGAAAAAADDDDDDDDVVDVTVAAADDDVELIFKTTSL